MATGRDHLGEELLELVRIGGCHIGVIFYYFIINLEIDSGSHTDFIAGLLENGADEVAGGGFAIGAGDTDNFEAGAGIFIK